MSAIGPGDWVECVDAGRSAHGVAKALRVGALYRIAWVGFGTRPNTEHVACCRLEGIQMPPGKTGYLLSRFRPVYRPNADIIEFLKQPLPDMVDA